MTLFDRSKTITAGLETAPKGHANFTPGYNAISGVNREYMSWWLAESKLLEDRTVITLNVGVPGVYEPLLDLSHASHNAGDNIVVDVNYAVLSGVTDFGPTGDSDFFGIDWLSDFKGEANVVLMPITDRLTRVDQDAFGKHIIDPINTLLENDGLLMTTAPSWDVAKDIQAVAKRNFNCDISGNQRGGLHAYSILARKKQ